MKEDEVYIGTKIWFEKNGFIALAGQPPNGCDNIPSIEIKKNKKIEKGSKGAFKPDLVFANANYLVIVECKSFYDKKDQSKLCEVLLSQDRQKLFYHEIIQRGIFKRRKLEEYFARFEQFSFKLRVCLAYSDKSETSIMEKVMTLSLTSIKGNGTLILPTKSCYSIKI